jgi:predicted metal-dependent hydrolase
MKHLPTEIYLSSIHQAWKINYHLGAERAKICTFKTGDLAIYAPNCAPTISRLLKKWLVNHAKQTFYPWLRALSEETGLHFHSLTVRHQRSQWGSCNAHKTINLNSLLLFLPQELVRHVMIHELCHTVHLNHSSDFWHLVERFDGDFRAHRQALKQAEKYLPLYFKLREGYTHSV